MKFLLNGEKAELKFRHRKFSVPIAVPSRMFGKKRMRVVRAQTTVKLRWGSHIRIHAYSWCSYRDRFDYEEGRRQALRHLMEDFFLPRVERTQIWSAYLRGMERANLIDLEQRRYEETQDARIEKEGVAKEVGAAEIEEAAVSRTTNGSGLYA